MRLRCVIRTNSCIEMLLCLIVRYTKYVTKSRSATLSMSAHDVHCSTINN